MDIDIDIITTGGSASHLSDSRQMVHARERKGR